MPDQRAEVDMNTVGGNPERDCSICGQKVPFLQEWQAVTGQAFIGHRECAETEAAKFAMVKKSDLQHVLSRFLDPMSFEGDDEEIVNRLWMAVAAVKR